MKDFVKQTENELSHLSHIVGAHLKQLNAILKKGHNVHSVKVRVPKALKAPPSFSQQVVSGVKSRLTGIIQPSVNTSKNSGGQTIADLASAISKAMSRDL